jgi:hypothetical protein
VIGIRRAAALAVLLLPSLAAAQRDVSLETLARALEGRLGICARSLEGGEEIALNADQPFPAGALRGFLGAESAAATGPSAASPRALVDAMKARHLALPRDAANPERRALLCEGDRALVGAGLPPAVEVGAATSGLPKAPGVLGYVATRAGDLVFCVMAADLGSEFSAPQFFPEILEALVRRLLPAYQEPPPDPKPPGLVLASLHERDQDPKLFPASADEGAADLRRGAQRLSFRAGDVGRVAVLGRPLRATRVTVQWWSPAARAESRTVQVLPGAKVSDALFDLPLEKAGAWRVRVAFGDVIVLDEKLFVTARTAR